MTKTPAEIARELTPEQVRILLDAGLADSHEWWLREQLGDYRLAGGDLVLTDLGAAVRAALLEGER